MNVPYKIDDYIGVGYTAKMLGISIRTLREWDRKGIIKPYRNPSNNYRMYKPDEVKKLLENVKK